MIQPFSPDEALEAKGGVIPEFVIAAVNQLLAKRFSGNSCTIRQNEVIKLAEEIAREMMIWPEDATRQSFFDAHWLDFETLYRAKGWKVTYDKPGYCESYEAFWEFKRDTSAADFDRRLAY